MNKSELLGRIRSLQRELDGLVDAVIAMEEPKPQVVQVQQASSDEWLTVAQVCKELHISDSTFYEWLKGGLLPPGLQFGPKSRRWKMSEIRAWREAKQNPSVEVPRRRRGRPSRVVKIGALCNA